MTAEPRTALIAAPQAPAAATPEATPDDSEGGGCPSLREQPVSAVLRHMLEAHRDGSLCTATLIIGS